MIGQCLFESSRELPKIRHDRSYPYSIIHDTHLLPCYSVIIILLYYRSYLIRMKDKHSGILLFVSPDAIPCRRRRTKFRVKVLTNVSVVEKENTFLSTRYRILPRICKIVYSSIAHIIHVLIIRLTFVLQLQNRFLKYLSTVHIFQIIPREIYQ